jgi:NADH dehydrogenase [ubiquinone] 1 alpha subcomplex assembly factor 3
LVPACHISVITPSKIASHHPFCIRRYLPHAFLVNNVQVEGPILCLPDSWLLWDVQTFNDVNPQNLAILDLLDPPPEVLVVGCGAVMRPLPQQLQDFLRARNIAVEMLDTVSEA